MSKVTQITDSQFESEVIKSKQPVVVDFFATWCPPCQRLAPILEDLANVYDGRVKFVKLNTDQEQEWAGKLGVRGLPTLAYFKDGEAMTTEGGLAPPNRIKDLLEKMLA
jgi:thioredoxin 1